MRPRSSVELSGKRVLIVEDDYFIASDLARYITGAGGVAVGPVPSLTAAETQLASEPVDAAILDINLNGTEIYPLAEALKRRDIPFLFLTGYSKSSVRADFADVPHVEKPYLPENVVAAVGSLRRSGTD